LIGRPIGSTHALFLERSAKGFSSNLCLSLLSKRAMRAAAAGATSAHVSSAASAACSA